MDSECLFADDLANGLDETVVASDFTGKASIACGLCDGLVKVAVECPVAVDAFVVADGFEIGNHGFDF